LSKIQQDTYYGMHTFDQDLERLHSQNLISTQEALSNATNLEDLALKLRGVDRGIWNEKEAAAGGGSGGGKHPPAQPSSGDGPGKIIQLPKEHPKPKI